MSKVSTEASSNHKWHHLGGGYKCVSCNCCTFSVSGHFQNKVMGKKNEQLIFVSNDHFLFMLAITFLLRNVGL